VENREEEDAFVRGEMESGVMGDAAMVPGAESIFCEVSRSTSMGVLPNLTAVVWHVTSDKGNSKRVGVRETMKSDTQKESCIFIQYWNPCFFG